MEADFITKLWELGPAFVIMGLAIWYFWKANAALQIIIVNKDNEIDNLNKDFRLFMENNINKSHEAINNSTVAFNALKEVLVNRQ